MANLCFKLFCPLFFFIFFNFFGCTFLYMSSCTGATIVGILVAAPYHCTCWFSVSVDQRIPSLVCEHPSQGLTMCTYREHVCTYSTCNFTCKSFYFCYLHSTHPKQITSAVISCYRLCAFIGLPKYYYYFFICIHLFCYVSN